ncbi:hypothetical protein C0992_007491 [Termitomyces sp. T32_za158]|nr:hypothetical protein C0992_007491 [Termitomyces sp. T32_za158]
MTDATSFNPQPAPGLKKISPYWYPYTTMAKERWLGRELLEVVSTEFRDRSMEYYRYALDSGVTTINGRVARPDTIIMNGDCLQSTLTLYQAVNRLDRLTSGLMIIPLTAERARQLTSEFMASTIRKEYVARCKGEFPTEEVVCEEPLLTVDRQMGLNIVHPEGKPAKTVFNRIRYDPNTDTSVVRCEPLTGRSHQIRVHLQFLGHPIANDPVYSETKIWGPNLGKGGIDIVPSDERSAPVPPPHLQSDTDAAGSPESLTKGGGEQGKGESGAKLLPRETGQDIGMGSPVPLSSEAVGVITSLRNMKDEDEDWSRWRDVVFRAKGKLTPNLTLKPQPPSNQRKRGNYARFVDEKLNQAMDSLVPIEGTTADSASSSITQSTVATPDISTPEPEIPGTPPPVQLSEDEVLQKVATMEPLAESTAVVQSDNLYCPECYLPLHPDPKPERLYIFLHAKQYTTSLGSFKTEMPEWAAEGWNWDRS